MPYDPRRYMDWASRGMVDRDRYLSMLDSSGTPEQDEPMPTEEPQSRFSSGLDAASLAVLQQLRNLPPARGFGAGLAQGVAGGLAQSRAQKVMERKAAFEEAQKQARARNASADRFRKAAGMATMQARFADERQQARDAAISQRERNRTANRTPGGGKRYPLTPRLRQQLREANIFVPDDATDVPESAVVRDMPTTPAVGNLSPEAQQFWAQNAVTTGGMFPANIGRNPALVTNLLEQAAAEAKKVGMSGYDMGRARMAYRADAASLSNLQKMMDNAEAFGATLDKNMGVLRGTMTKIKETGSSWANKPVRALVGATGNKAQAQFRAALLPVQVEAARLMNSPNMTGVLTNEARAELQSVIDGNATVTQLEGVLEILETDKKNRIESYRTQRDFILNRGGRGSPPADSSAVDTVVTSKAGVTNGLELLNRVMGRKKP